MAHRKNLLVASITLLLCFALAELFLRLAGFQPGKLAPRWLPFNPVDSLIVDHQFYVDSDGIFRANAQYFNGYGIPIDSLGFRKLTATHDSSEPRVLFIGDSFTWGASAQPITNSFADIVNQQGYHCYNAGIPGTGPHQYLKVASKLVPAWKPDYTLICFYMGNDVITTSNLNPDLPAFYQTNAGWIASVVEGKTVSPQEAYEYYVHKYYVTEDEPLWKRLMARSSIGTLILALPDRLHEYYQWKHHTPVSGDYLEAISKICQRAESRMLIFVIPEYRDLQCKRWTKMKEQLERFEVYYPVFLSESDYYPLPDGHFNNMGHKKFATFIVQTLDSLETSRRQ